jgi:ABC-type polysaccharide/polyol phosphate transport system ATPase subunit
MSRILILIFLLALPVKSFACSCIYFDTPVSIKDFNEGVTILISSHDLKYVTEVCDRILLLKDGFIIKDTNKNEDTLSELEKYFEIY